MQPKPLRGFDEECRQFVTEQYEQRGLNLHPSCNPEKIVKNDDGTLTLHLKHDSGDKTVLDGLDQVLLATGRKPNTAKLGLKEVLSHRCNATLHTMHWLSLHVSWILACLWLNSILFFITPSVRQRLGLKPSRCA